MLGTPMASHWLPLNYNRSDFAYGSTVCMPYVHGLCLLLWFNCKTHSYSWRAHVIYTVKGLSTLEFISPLLSASVTFLLVTGACLEPTIHWAFESKPLKKYLCINDSVGTFKITPEFTWKHAVCLTANSQGDVLVEISAAEALADPLLSEWEQTPHLHLLLLGDMPRIQWQ